MAFASAPAGESWKRKRRTDTDSAMSNDRRAAPHEFEVLVRLLLEAHGFVFEDVGSVDRGFDFVAHHANTRWAIEAKYYRTDRPQVGLLESAAARLVTSLSRANADKAILVVSSFIGRELRTALEQKLGIMLVDRVDIFAWAPAQPELVDRFCAVLEAAPPSVTVQNPRGIRDAIHDAPFPKSARPITDRRGTTLCSELRALDRGRTTWSAYEDLCRRILRYLFPAELQGWRAQQRTDDGLNRFDFVCRVNPITDFWGFLVHQLNSRYILFEFKNYAGPLKQGQVLTTEKYLLEKALRRASIILSRLGADKNAIAMTQGAMREHGKFIVVLDDDQVCRMLHMKERGEDPGDLLFDVADEFLLSLPR
jgi:hypothetical protein